jgi:hypothetical protein
MATFIATATIAIATTEARAWLCPGRDLGREADFSAALLTVRLCVASVEMTVLRLGEETAGCHATQFVLD